MISVDHHAPPGGPPFAEHARGEHRARWLATVDEAYVEMERRIDCATRSVRFETYILREEGPATWLRAALLRARTRGVAVSLLLDAFGTEGLRESFLDPLRDAGVAIAIFNPHALLRRSLRNHRKLLAVDGEHAVVGGFNIAPEYAGDGVTHGWCDTSVYVGGPTVHALEQSFDAMFDLAPFTARTLRRFRRAMHHLPLGAADAPVGLLVSGPALSRGALRHALYRDLRAARDVAIASAYFLPSLLLRRLLYRVAQRQDGQVRVLLAGRTDVPVAKLAAEKLYGRLLRRKVQVYEYQPQILHAKLLVMDDIVCVGSCNLDRRSLHINYELLLRFNWPELAADVRQWYARALAHAEPVDYRRWRAHRGFWRRIASRLAYVLLSRVDPLLARRGFRSIN